MNMNILRVPCIRRVLFGNYDLNSTLFVRRQSGRLLPARYYPSRFLPYAKPLIRQPRDVMLSYDIVTV
jgi:hypothetical protein